VSRSRSASFAHAEARRCRTGCRRANLRRKRRSFDRHGRKTDMRRVESIRDGRRRVGDARSRSTQTAVHRLIRGDLRARALQTGDFLGAGLHSLNWGVSGALACDTRARFTKDTKQTKERKDTTEEKKQGSACLNGLTQGSLEVYERAAPLRRLRSSPAPR